MFGGPNLASLLYSNTIASENGSGDHFPYLGPETTEAEAFVSCKVLSRGKEKKKNHCLHCTIKGQSTGYLYKEQNQVSLNICLAPVNLEKRIQKQTAQSPHPGDTIPPIPSISKSQAIPVNFGAS